MRLEYLYVYNPNFSCHVPALPSLNRTLEAKRSSAAHTAPPGSLDQSFQREKKRNCESILQKTNTNKQRVCPYPTASVMLYVSTDSWQTRFHNSAPVRVLQGVLSMGPVPRPRRLDFFLVSSPTEVGVKWLTSRQQRKWLIAPERLETSTPCQDIITRLKFTFESC